MKTIQWMGWVVCLLLSAIPASAVEPVNTTFFGNVAIEGYDPVAYFNQNEPVKGDKGNSYEWAGAQWRFASAENLAAFKADPERYAPQYGGYCAYAVAKGTTAGIDPAQFTILDGKLYLNYNASIQQKWSANRDDFIRQADKNWPELRD